MSDRNKHDFREVRKDSPCVVCGKTSWCCVSGDGLMSLCMRREGGKVKQFKNGQVGYLYRLDGLDIKPPPPPKPKSEKIKDVWSVAKAMATHKEADRKRRELAAEIGVSLASVESMAIGVGWDRHNGHEFASVPSWRGGRCVGISRRYKGGKKRTLAGTSNSGVFVCRYWWLKPGDVFVVEGASDVLALDSVNLCAIGRPSNIGGAAVIADMIKSRAVASKEVLVVSELDFKEHDDLPLDVRGRHDPDCQACQLCAPGVYGAQKTCEELVNAGLTARCVVPAHGCKDSREMLNKDAIVDWLAAIRPRSSFYNRAVDIGG